ncbi:MAG: hypothetical protein ABI548_28155 [Polyangiaceae bacterium]
MKTAFLVASTCAVALACSSRKPAEDAGSAQRAGAGLDEGAKNAKESAKEAGEKVGDATEKAADKVAHETHE